MAQCQTIASLQLAVQCIILNCVSPPTTVRAPPLRAGNIKYPLMSLHLEFLRAFDHQAFSSRGDLWPDRGARSRTMCGWASSALATEATGNCWSGASCPCRCGRGRPIRRREEQRPRDGHYGDGEPCRPYRDFRDMRLRATSTWSSLLTMAGMCPPPRQLSARAWMSTSKPLGVTIGRTCASQSGPPAWRRFQCGTQQRSMAHCRHGCELVRNGRVE